MALVVKFYSFNDGLMLGTLLAMTFFTLRYSGTQAGVKTAGDARGLGSNGGPFRTEILLKSMQFYRCQIYDNIAYTCIYLYMLIYIYCIYIYMSYRYILICMYLHVYVCICIRALL